LSFSRNRLPTGFNFFNELSAVKNFAKRARLNFISKNSR
jgi:hypothetical protein